jgi:hypothetical protein
VFLLPLGFLIVIQARNMGENKTTFERYGSRRPVEKKSMDYTEIK